MRDLGLDVTIDAIGNVVATRPGTDPDAAPVMTGSHIDTVRTGGRFDGNLGVLAGLEVVETLEQHGVATERPIAVGLLHRRGGRPLRARHARQPRVRRRAWRSRRRSTSRAVDDGARLGDELDRIGYAGPLPCPAAAPPHAYVELHIEQGPILEDEGVDDRRGRGRAGHLVDRGDDHRPVGPRRHDADAPAPRRRLRRGARSSRSCATSPASIGGAQVATVGRLEVTPEPRQRRAATATLTVDLRNTDEAVLQRGRGRARRRASTRVAAAEGVTVDDAARWPASSRSTFDPAMIDLVEATAQRLGHSTRRMPSGAGHDAQMLARVCPTAMIFTPSVDGLSHNIAEYTEPDDITAGADVLLQTLLALAGAPHDAVGGPERDRLA